MIIKLLRMIARLYKPVWNKDLQAKTRKKFLAQVDTYTQKKG